MKLTQQVVNRMEPREKQYFCWCSELRGFGVRVLPSGVKTFIAKYRVNGKQKLAAVGQTGKVKADMARRQAMELISQASLGVDIREERKVESDQPTVNDLADKFVAEYIPHHLRQSTASEYRRSIDKFIRPKLGKELITDLTRDKIAAFHHSDASIPYQANRTLGILSVMLSQAEIWGMRPEGINPCVRVKRFKEKKRERYLSADEMAQLADTLNQEYALAPSAVTAFRLLMLTGCRLGEIQKLKWDYVNWERNEIRLPDEVSKTGARTIFLGEQVLEILKSVEPVPDNPYVITGRKPGAYLTDLQKPWRRVREAAGLEDVRIHDLRHTFAAKAASSGLSLPMIGKLLGHTQAQTTARYAHLAADPVRKANSDIVRIISEAMDGK